MVSNPREKGRGQERESLGVRTTKRLGESTNDRERKRDGPYEKTG